MTEQATLYLLKCKDEKINNNLYLISVKQNKKLRTVKEYVNSRRELKNSIIKNNYKNYEIVFFKNIKFGSNYEYNRIIDYYNKELKIK